MAEKPRKVRDTTLSCVDRDAPAYRIIYGVFGGLGAFVTKSVEARLRIPKSSAHLWLVNGLIPAHRQEDVVAIARHHHIALDLALFVPVPRERDAAKAA